MGGPKRPEEPATPDQPGAGSPDQDGARAAAPAAASAASGTSGTSGTSGRPSASSGSPGSGARPAPGRRRDPLLPLLALLGLLALVCAAALPLAPVRHERPVVSWPQDPAAPVSSSLVLAAQTPAAMRVSANCPALRAAGATPGGVLFSTQRPDVARATQQAVLWEVRDGRAVLTAQGEEVADLAVPATGDCEVVADLRDGRLAVTLDGQPVGERPGTVPRLDSLVSDLSQATAGTGQQLRVQVAVDDEFASSPTPLKLVLVGLLVASGLLLLAGVALLDRRGHPVRAGPAGATDGTAVLPLPRRRAALRPVSAHVVVVLGLVAWTALAPMTDDDGYYAAMARNAPDSGYIGQYYQLYNQSFVPLTWPWYVLSWWEQLGGGPLFLRIPALLLCVATWFALRRALDLVLPLVPAWRRGRDGEDGQPSRGGARHAAVWLLAVCYAAASAPFVMGVRPEGVVAALSAWTLVGVLTALRSRRLLPLAVAVVLAALSCASHPTGLVAVAPLVAFLPRLWALVSPGAAAGVGRVACWVRALAVIAPGAMASAAGFADGTLFDYREGRRVFTAIEEPLRWTDEYVRYGFLLNPNIPMGAYAKRTTVLVGLLAVLCALLLSAAAQRRGPGGAAGGRPAGPAGAAGVLPAELGALGATGLVAYLALWITPSKWTHHFGSLSGLLPLLVVVLVLVGPGVAARLWPRTALAPRLGLVAAVVAVAALSFRGPNLWPYSWQIGLPFQGDSLVGRGPLASPAVWVLVAVVCVLLARLVLRRGARRGREEPAEAVQPAEPAAGAATRADALVVGAAATAVVALGVTTAVLGGTFAASVYGTWDTYSAPQSRVKDPFNDRCDAAGAIQVADPARSTPLPALDGGQGAQVEGFDEQGGWWNGDPLPGTPGQGAFGQVWGSLTREGDDGTGDLTTGWYDLSGRPDDEYVTITVAGRLGDGNSLEVQYGRQAADGTVEVLRSRPVDDEISSPEWRSLVLLRPGQDARGGADAVRLVARDASGGTGAWLAVSAPVAQPAVRLADWIPSGAVTVTSWQFTYLFSCQQQPTVARGVVERPEYAVLWGPGSLEGTNDSIWQYGRGGLAAPLPDAATLFQPVSEFTHANARQAVGQWGQVVELAYPYAPAAYDVALEPETAPGWSGPSVPALG
ncbi:arabinosyltransferase domain-containing protein [Quadrisphaera sp. KR29]|uniref:arabinosyltransferase domain-containing protein n=1 Tax=Quadrisphaera sp. KR29 TaxID=3461391 RepID=UPI00404424CC